MCEVQVSKRMVDASTQTDPLDDRVDILTSIMEGFYRQQHEKMLGYCEAAAVSRARAQIESAAMSDRMERLIRTVNELQLRNIELRHDENRNWEQVVALVDAIETFRERADDNNRWLIMEEVHRATAHHGVSIDILYDTDATESDMELASD